MANQLRIRTLYGTRARACVCVCLSVVVKHDKAGGGGGGGDTNGPRSSPSCRLQQHLVLILQLIMSTVQSPRWLGVLRKLGARPPPTTIK